MIPSLRGPSTVAPPAVTSRRNRFCHLPDGPIRMANMPPRAGHEQVRLGFPPMEYSAMIRERRVERIGIVFASRSSSASGVQPKVASYMVPALGIVDVP